MLRPPPRTSSHCTTRNAGRQGCGFLRVAFAPFHPFHLALLFGDLQPSVLVDVDGPDIRGLDLAAVDKQHRRAGETPGFERQEQDTDRGRDDQQPMTGGGRAEIDSEPPHESGNSQRGKQGEDRIGAGPNRVRSSPSSGGGASATV